MEFASDVQNLLTSFNPRTTKKQDFGTYINAQYVICYIAIQSVPVKGAFVPQYFFHLSTKFQKNQFNNFLKYYS